MSDEEQYHQWIDEFKRGNSYAFDKIWVKAKHLINFSKYYDPSGARSREDFEAIARAKCFISLFGDGVVWEPNKGYTVISWIRNCMLRAILREVKTIKKEVRCYSLDLLSEDGLHESTLKDTASQHDNLEDTEQIQLYCYSIHAKLSANYKKAKNAYHLRLAFPNISVKTISGILKVSKAQCYLYLAIVKKTAQEVIRSDNSNR